ncbi:MAG: DMT family transporter [Gammaproteobacteria bacterium]
MLNTPTPSRLALPGLFLGALAIALSPIWVRLSELSPAVSAFHRVFLALPLLWAWILWTRVPRARRGRRVASLTARDRLALLAAGLLFAGDLGFWHWSITLTSVANATLLANFAPVFVTLGAVVLFRQRIRALFLVGMVTALLGAAILIGADFNSHGTHLRGDVLGLITAVFYAAYLLAVGRLRSRLDVLTVMAWTSLGTALGLLPVALLAEGPFWPQSANGWWVLLGLAWISHSGGQGLIAFALAHLPATFSSVGLLLQPAIAALLAWWWLNEALGPWQLAGGIVVLAGIYLAHRGR